MIGTTLGHYRIQEMIGAGGMGVVYRALDERLEREVAVKILPEGALADAVARRRFRREALAISKVTHPAIAVIHDFDTQDSVDYLVMELVRGAPLTEKIEAGPLAEPEAVALAIQIAEALDAAHEQRVIHRDLKPGNVIVAPSGRIKLLDFGLAKLLTREDDTRPVSVTMPDQVVGTIPYMAPEQLLGDPLDARVDLYALGVVLYEMVTGRRPFARESQAALVSDILNARPAPPTRARSGLSGGLESIILRALEKSRDRRYATAGEMLGDLRRVASAASSSRSSADEPARRRFDSVAVLPLENLSGDAEQEFFADGMTEALIADLAQIETLRVISRTSVMAYKGVRKPLPEIARELGVDAIVEGSVMRSGKRVRITAQLIEATSDRHLWAKSYERELNDILELQSEVAQAISREVRVKLAPWEQEKLDRVRRVDPRAYEHYLKGRFQLNRRTLESIRRAIEQFEAAIALDETYAAAHSGLSDCHMLRADRRVIHPAEPTVRAQQFAERAVTLDPELAEAHVSLAHASMHQFEWAKAEREYLRALELNPGLAIAHQWYATFLMCEDRAAESLREAQRARELDPLSAPTAVTLASVYIHFGRLEEASSHLKALLEWAPEFPGAHIYLAEIHEMMGRMDESIEEMRLATRLTGIDPQDEPRMAYLYARAGHRQEAERALEHLLARSRDAYVSTFDLAAVHAALDRKDEAFAWLERAVEERCVEMVFLKIDPRMAQLRSDPRFESVLGRVGLLEAPAEVAR